MSAISNKDIFTGSIDTRRQNKLSESPTNSDTKPQHQPIIDHQLPQQVGLTHNFTLAHLATAYKEIQSRFGYKRFTLLRNIFHISYPNASASQILNRFLEYSDKEHSDSLNMKNIILGPFPRTDDNSIYPTANPDLLSSPLASVPSSSPELYSPFLPFSPGAPYSPDMSLQISRSNEEDKINNLIRKIKFELAKPAINPQIGENHLSSLSFLNRQSIPINRESLYTEKDTIIKEKKNILITYLQNYPGLDNFLSWTRISITNSLPEILEHFIKTPHLLPKKFTSDLFVFAGERNIHEIIELIIKNNIHNIDIESIKRVAITSISNNYLEIFNIITTKICSSDQLEFSVADILPEIFNAILESPSNTIELFSTLIQILLKTNPHQETINHIFIFSPNATFREAIINHQLFKKIDKKICFEQVLTNACIGNDIDSLKQILSHKDAQEINQTIFLSILMDHCKQFHQDPSTHKTILETILYSKAFQSLNTSYIPIQFLQKLEPEITEDNMSPLTELLNDPNISLEVINIALTHAVYTNNVDFTKILLQYLENPQEDQIPMINNIFHIASQQGHEEIINLLINNELSRHLYTDSIIHSLYTKNDEILQAILNNSMILRVNKSELRSLFEHVTKKSDLSKTRKLLNHDLYMQAFLNKNRINTALFRSAIKKDSAIAGLILEKNEENHHVTPQAIRAYNNIIATNRTATDPH